MAQTMDKKTDLILNKKPIWKGLLYLSFPVFLVNILKTLHDIVDGIFLGRVSGTFIDANNEIASIATAMQSAVSLTWPIFFVFISFGMGLSVAGNALVGQYVGKGDYVNAKKFANNTLFIALFLGVVFNMISFIFAPQILATVADNDRVYGYAITYLRIRSFELPVLFMSFAFQAIRRATGDTVTPVIISAAGLLLNMILTPILVLELNMGVAGAATATVVAQVVLIPWMVYYLIKPKTGISVKFKINQLNKVVIKDIFNIGIPASLGQSIQAIGFVVLNFTIFSLGQEVSAAFYIGNRINSLVMFPVSAVSTIVAIYIAQNVGAGNVRRAKETVKQGILLGVIMMIIGVAIILPFRVPIVKLFSEDALAIKHAATYTLYIGIGLPLMALFQTFLNTFQGSGETKYSFILAIVRLWIFRLPFVMLAMYVFDLGAIGIWYSMLLSNVLAAILGTYLYSKVKFIPKTREAI
ncbi:MATE family efflux transporter [Hujiaoplasma nucleasis]|uniref:Probable multidrug resistance protein NorM n=1 Tax=Hujiaoplasma nucleasis TaxID=2725268 RepID=A0A7L6N7M7_9MOLU|nr:MATE family efflux transporter [Hujiaoplasma nucleasis]QLY40544.1 MATE family efflux transporter [Hujiaoplasma nucleasis]